jgi:hypothetical protein
VTHLQRLHLFSSSFSCQRVRFLSTCIQFSVKLTLEWIRLKISSPDLCDSPSTPPPCFVVVLPPARTLLSTCVQFSVKLTLEWTRLKRDSPDFCDSPSTPAPHFVILLPPARTLPLYVHPIQCQIDTRVDSTRKRLTGLLRLTFNACASFRCSSPASAYASSLRASNSVSN